MDGCELKFTRHEAALITDVPVTEVDKAYDEGWFDRPVGRQARGVSKRCFGPADLLHLRLLKDMTDEAIVRDESKRILHRHIQRRVPTIVLGDKAGVYTIAIRFSEHGCPTARARNLVVLFHYVTGNEPTPQDLDIDFLVARPDEPPVNVLRSCFAQVKDCLAEPLRLRWVSFNAASAWGEISDRLADMTAARLSVVSDPEIRGGEPVVRGTRIPVHMLEDLVEQGASIEELLQDYPTIDEERLKLALIYARTHPPAGRPKKRPWAERPPS